MSSPDRLGRRSLVSSIQSLWSLAFLQGRLTEGTRYQREMMSLGREFLRDRRPELAETLEMESRILELESTLWYRMDPPITAERIERELAASRAALPDSAIPNTDFATMFRQVGHSERGAEKLAAVRQQAEA